MESICPNCGNHDNIYPKRVDGKLVCRECAR